MIGTSRNVTLQVVCLILSTVISGETWYFTHLISHHLTVDPEDGSTCWNPERFETLNSRPLKGRTASTASVGSYSGSQPSVESVNKKCFPKKGYGTLENKLMIYFWWYTWFPRARHGYLRQGQGSPSVGPRGGEASTRGSSVDSSASRHGTFAGWNYQRPQLGSTFFGFGFKKRLGREEPWP